MGSAETEWVLAGTARVACTGWPQGDMTAGGEAGRRRRRNVVDLPWTLLHQVHGARVVVVDRPGQGSGEAADAAVSSAAGAALAVLTADCAPVALASAEGVIGVAHAGWKGLRAGVVEATVQAMRRVGATRVEAAIGPCIHRCCYAFGDEDLAAMVSRFGPSVRAVTDDGHPALDLVAGLRQVLHAAGASLSGESETCTAHSPGLWSWRESGTARRQATVVWR